jgi:AcrR family transcriptional regulator
LKPTDTYHHGHLREELLRLGLAALETEGAAILSLRSLAERAGVSKTAPYQEFD